MAAIHSSATTALVSAKGELGVVDQSQQPKAIGSISCSGERTGFSGSFFSREKTSWKIKAEFQKFQVRDRQNCARFCHETSFWRVQQAQPRLTRVGAFDHLEGESEEEAATNSEGSEGGEAAGKSIKIDLQLPRRRLLVEFTCNLCQTRTQRLVNPEAYKSGTVYVQCGGCEKYHKLVDNLGLVVEYDFRNEADANSA